MAANEDPQDDIITVGKRNDDGRAVWDRHPNHPSNYGQPAGEVFISDMRPYQVYRSAGIGQKLGENEIREINERAAASRLEAHETVVAEQQARREEALAAASASAVSIPPSTTTTPIDTSEEDAEDDGDGSPRSSGVARPRRRNAQAEDGGAPPER